MSCQFCGGDHCERSTCEEYAEDNWAALGPQQRAEAERELDPMYRDDDEWGDDDD